MVENKTVRVENAETLSVYQAEVLNEFTSILDYWITYTVDEEHGGFYGSVSNDNRPDNTAAKGLVLNSRILWAFSAAFLHTKEQQYLDIAERAYQYIINHFI